MWEFQNAKRPEQDRRRILEASLVLPFMSAVINPQPGPSPQPPTTPECGTEAWPTWSGCSSQHQSDGDATPKHFYIPGTADLPYQHPLFQHLDPTSVLERISRGRGIPWGPTRPRKAEQHGCPLGEGRGAAQRTHDPIGAATCGGAGSPALGPAQ